MGVVDKETADLSEKCKQQNIVLSLTINHYELCCFALENQIWCFICLTQTTRGTENTPRPSAPGSRVCL